jgi:hypothetical protein
MQHGRYVKELESVAWEHGYVLGHGSLAELIQDVDLSKLSEYSFSERVQFYSELIKQLKTDPKRAKVDGKQALREEDALSIIEKMSKNAKSLKLSGKIRDIWCAISGRWKGWPLTT